MTWLKLKTFINSLFFHVYRGFPKTTLTEITERYAICSVCSEFNITKQECSICGCSINTKKVFLNKLAWSDQECPIGKWQKITKR
jgi:hypothetical protein